MPLTRLLGIYLKPYRGALAAVLLFQLAAVGASLLLPTLNADIIDGGIARGDTGHIINRGAIMIAVSLVQIVSQICSIWFGARAALGLGRDMRAAVFSRTLTFSTQEMSHFGTPSLMTRTTNDVQQVQQLVMMSSFMIIQAPIMMIGGVAMALREDLGLSWMVGVSVAVLALVIGVLMAQTMPLFARFQTLIDRLNQVLRERLSGLRVIRAFVREPYESERFAVANHDLAHTGISVGRRMMTLFPTVALVMNLGTVGVLWFGSLKVDAGQLAVGQLTAFVQYLTLILMSVMMGTMIMMIGPRAAVCARRIEDVLTTTSSITAPDSPQPAPAPLGQIDFEQVSFTYPGAEAPVLRDINLSLRPGQTTAIIGSTGSGKSTLVNLIPRLFDVSSGRVRVDGVDVRHWNLEQLWARIGLVPQRSYLFTGTVGSNLRYGDPTASDEALWHALTIAQAADFVEKLPEGLESPITQGGTNVSGGQRQRLAIARALVRRPPIYIFDDSFSALDVATDARVRDALGPETAESTVLIVAQRVSTIRQADQIVVLDDGCIVGVGRHDDLVQSCATYAEIVESQLRTEEAAA